MHTRAIHAAASGARNPITIKHIDKLCRRRSALLVASTQTACRVRANPGMGRHVWGRAPVNGKPPEFTGPRHTGEESRVALAAGGN